MRYRLKELPYTFDDGGGCSNVVVIHIDFDRELEGFAQFRDVVQRLDRAIDDHSHQENVRSAYDCTGQAFGSSWIRLDRRVTDWGIDFVYTHGWAIDI